MNAYPDSNPKTVQGAAKVPLHLVPPSAKHFLALALEDGAHKYGPYNWRDKQISVSVYKAAAERHLDAFWDGEELAEDSQVHHLAHAMACMALMLDAITLGKLNDDRPLKGMASGLQAQYAAGRTKSAQTARQVKDAWDAAAAQQKSPAGIKTAAEPTPVMRDLRDQFVVGYAAKAPPPPRNLPCNGTGDGS